MNATLRFEGVTQRFGDTTALDDVTADLAGGSIHGLLGRNGSGKTTLLSIGAAFRRPDEGRATLDGDTVFENAAATSRIAFIRGPGDTVVNDWPDDRIADALAFAGRFRPGWDQAYADELVAGFGLSPTLRLSELSTGKRAAVGVVLGLASRAPVTIFDETHLGMDAPSRTWFYDELLRDCMEHPRTVVLSTHLIEEVAPLLETVTILDAGRIRLQDEADAIRRRGVTVTGPVDVVDRFTAAHTVLGKRQLGPTKAVTLYGELGERERRDAIGAGLELGPVGLQDMFIHLTDPAGADR